MYSFLLSRQKCISFFVFDIFCFTGFNNFKVIFSITFWKPFFYTYSYMTLINLHSINKNTDSYFSSIVNIFCTVYSISYVKYIRTLVMLFTYLTVKYSIHKHTLTGEYSCGRYPDIIIIFFF